MRASKIHGSSFGWTATSDSAGTTVTLCDPQGRTRAVWTHSPRSSAKDLQLVRLSSNGRHRVRLLDGSAPAGEADIDNGRPRPARRRDHDGWIEVHGRRYGTRHARRWRSTLLLDDRVVAVGRKGWFGRSALERSRPLDAIDELALALFWFAVTPGRPGKIWMIVESV